MRYFYKVDQKREPIPASNVRRKSKPSGRDWRELHNICCSPFDVPCTCGPRFWVKLDSTNKPVDFSLIKRTEKITPEPGLKYYEIPTSANECCGSLVYSFTNGSGVTGSAFTIKKNGHIEDVFDTSSNNTFKFKEGDVIQLTLTQGTATIYTIDVAATGDPDAVQTVFGVGGDPVSITFIAHSGASYNISAGTAA